MMPYNREAAVRYAKKWALSRNPLYMDFEKLGGDCTNFVSQCLYAGIAEMNYSKSNGWYYLNSYSRSPSWTGVEFLFQFLIHNRSSGPHAVFADGSSLQSGDVAQLANAGVFHHSLLIVSIQPDGPLVAAHSADVWMHPLSSYAADQIRYLHILT